VVEAGGAWLCVCAYMGPKEAGVDLLGEGEALLARIRGGTMAVRDYHAVLAEGERLRVWREPPTLEVLSSKHAPTAVAVAEEAGGRRSFTWTRDGAIAAVLTTVPAVGAEPWTLEVPGWEDPLRCLAVLQAAERLVAEIERNGVDEEVHRR